MLATAAANTEFRGVALAPPRRPVRRCSCGRRWPAAHSRSERTVTVSAYVDRRTASPSVKAKLGTGASSTPPRVRPRLDRHRPDHGPRRREPQRSPSAPPTPRRPPRPPPGRSSGSIAAPEGQPRRGYVRPERQAGRSRPASGRPTRPSTSPTKKGQTRARRSPRPPPRSTASSCRSPSTEAAKAGKVKVTVDGKTTTSRPLRQEDGQPHQDLKLQGRAEVAHGRRQRARHQKHAKSKGTSVLLAA